MYGADCRADSPSVARAALVITPSTTHGPSRGEVDFGRIALVAQALTSAIDAEEVLDIVLMQGLAGLGADRANVAFIAGDALFAVAGKGYSLGTLSPYFPVSLRKDVPTGPGMAPYSTIKPLVPTDLADYEKASAIAVQKHEAYFKR